MKLSEATTKLLLERYGIAYATGHHPIAGTDIAIDGWTDAYGRRMLRARSPAHYAERMVPVGELAAGELVDGLRAYHHHLHDEAARTMLRNLFVRVSKLFEEEGEVTGFALDPIRLHERACTVIHAEIFALREPRVTERLERDRKTFHASGRQ